MKAQSGAQRVYVKRGHDPRGDALAFCVLMAVADRSTRVAVVEEGVPAHVVDDLAALMDVPLDYLTGPLGLSVTAMRRRINASKQLPIGLGDRVVELACLIGRVVVMVQEAGGPIDFDPARWIVNWLETPIPALGWRRPAELMITRSGQAMLEDLLARVRSGAYS